MKYRTDLILGEAFCIFIFFYILACQRSICGKSKSSNICSLSSLKSWKDINKNAIATRRSIARVSQTLYSDFIALVSLNIECVLFDFVGRKEVNQGSCENFQPFFKDFLRTTLDFQGRITYHKCNFTDCTKIAHS